MPKRDKSTAAFRLEVASKFEEAITRQKISKSKAAEDLGVSRQSLYQYLRGEAVPGSDVLRRACEIWGITLDYKGLSVNVSSFLKPLRGTRQEPRQLPLLLEAITALSDRDLDVKIARREQNVIELQVKIRFAS